MIASTPPCSAACIAHRTGADSVRCVHHGRGLECTAVWLEGRCAAIVELPSGRLVRMRLACPPAIVRALRGGPRWPKV